jgi:hypothetical protein
VKTILQPGSTTHRATCHECACVFSYESSDVHTNYVRGGDWVGCPQCGHAHRHYGASAASWPTTLGGCGGGRWSAPSGSLRKGSCFGS